MGFVDAFRMVWRWLSGTPVVAEPVRARRGGDWLYPALTGTWLAPDRTSDWQYPDLGA